MFVKLHAPNGTVVYHNVNQIFAVGLDDMNRTTICYNDAEFVVKETVSTVMGLIEQGKIHDIMVVDQDGAN